MRLPGFVNAHSHAFQRALRGRVEGGDFWAWRDSMLALAELQTPERVREEYTVVYREMLAAGYTGVGEFHYLGFDEARAAAEAADEAGIGFVLLLAAYGRGGLDRFRQPSVGAYLEQVPPDTLGHERRQPPATPPLAWSLLAPPRCGPSRAPRPPAIPSRRRYDTILSCLRGAAPRRTA